MQLSELNGVTFESCMLSLEECRHKVFYISVSKIKVLDLETLEENNGKLQRTLNNLLNSFFHTCQPASFKFRKMPQTRETRWKKKRLLTFRCSIPAVTNMVYQILTGNASYLDHSDNFEQLWCCRFRLFKELICITLAQEQVPLLNPQNELQ